jgi:polysaccharide biosynthesis protein PslH
MIGSQICSRLKPERHSTSVHPRLLSATRIENTPDHRLIRQEPSIRTYRFMTHHSPRRWIVVADSPFLPARGGGEREHLGFVEAATEAGLVAALVIPADADPAAAGRQDDIPALERLVAPAPLITTPRRRGPWTAFARKPYVVASRPTPKGLASKVQQLAPDADAVIAFSYKVSELGRVLAEELRLPALLRQHNLEGNYHKALAVSAHPPRSWGIRWEAWRIDRDERRLERSDWLNAIADISAADASVRSERSQIPVVHVPSFALGRTSVAADLSWERPRTSVVVFVGALDVSTNYDALAWFVAGVWPSVKANVPGAILQVVGRRPTVRVRDLVEQTDGMELHADVPDPADYLRRASAAVNPAVSGSGVNIKLVDYLAVGAPVVSTARGIAGLALRAGEDLLVADEPAAFADRVVQLLTSEDTAYRVGSAGHNTAMRTLDVRSSLAIMASALATGRSKRSATIQ